MRWLFSIPIIVCVVLQNISPLWARPSSSLLKWARTGYLEMQPEIIAAKNASDLSEFIVSKNPFIRASAVRRLGELGGVDSIPQLIQIFHKEEPVKNSEMLPIVKMEIVQTLGRIKSDEPAKVFSSLLKEHWYRRPGKSNGDKLLLTWMSEDCPVIHYLLVQSYFHVTNESVFKIVEEIALSEGLSEMFARFRGGIGDLAWKAYLRGQMIRDNVTEQKGQIQYLIKFREESIKRKLQHTPLMSIKIRAAESVIKMYDLSVLKDAENELREEMKDKAQDQKLRSEYNTLRRNAAYLSRLVKERVEKRKSARTGE